MTVTTGSVARLRRLIDTQRRHERWRDLATALRNLPRAFRLVWNAHPLGLIGLAALSLVAAGMPLAQAWTGKLIVDSVVQATSTGQPVAAGLQATLPLLLLEFGLIALNAVLVQLRTLIDHVIHARVDHTVTSAIISKAVAQDLQTFEDPAFYDKLQNARRDGGRRALGSVTTALSLAQQLLTLGSFAVLLLAFSPLVGLILVCATIPSFLAQTRYSSLHFRLLSWRAPEARRMQYLQQVLTVDSSAKEVKLFGLGEPLFGQYEAMFWRLYREDSGLALRRSRASVLWGLLNSASYYAAYAYIVWRTLSGSISLGDMTLYLTLCRQSQGSFQSVLGSINGLFESGLFLSNLYEFLDLTPQSATLPGARPVPRPIEQGIEFRDVGFRYPGRDEWALRNVSFTIAPGEKLALVGANGAGKTTLIKLLSRLYDPTEGQHLARRRRSARLRPRRAARRDRRDLPGLRALPGQRARQHRLRPDRARWTTRRASRRLPSAAARMKWSRRCPTATTPCWGAGSIAGTSCRAANGKRSRSAARLCATAPCWCWTSRPPAWMPSASTRCFSAFAT